MPTSGIYISLEYGGRSGPKVEGPVTDHSREYVPDLHEYKVVQLFPMLEDRNKEDSKKIGYFYYLDWNYCEVLKLKFDFSILPMSTLYHDNSF